MLFASFGNIPRVIFSITSHSAVKKILQLVLLKPPFIKNCSCGSHTGSQETGSASNKLAAKC